MDHWQLLILLVAGFAAGIVNAIAGGGSFILYPLLISIGVPPVTANATASPVVFFGQISSAAGYRSYIKSLPKRYFYLLIPLGLGALVGGFLLAQTSNRQFELVVPWFIIFATVLIIEQPRFHKLLFSKKSQTLEHEHAVIFHSIITLCFLALGTYVGFFGAGYGIVMLGLLGLSRLKSIHQMNALKNLGGIIMSGVASIYFISKGLIAWEVLPVLAIGNSVGGWIGASYSTKLPTKLIRGIIIGIGIIVSVILFARQYR